MSKILISYRSKTGFTQRYAEMAAKELGCDLAPWGQGDWSGYETVVFGTRAHAGRADGLKKALAAYRRSGAKRFVLFVTGAMPNAAEEAVEQFWAENLTAEELKDIPHFYMQAGLCYEKMGLVDRCMMWVAARALANRPAGSPEGTAFGEAIAHSFDISSREFVEPLVEFLRR